MFTAIRVVHQFELAMAVNYHVFHHRDYVSQDIHLRCFRILFFEFLSIEIVLELLETVGIAFGIFQLFRFLQIRVQDVGLHVPQFQLRQLAVYIKDLCLLVRLEIVNLGNVLCRSLPAPVPSAAFCHRFLVFILNIVFFA